MRLVPAEQAKRNCALPFFDVSTWRGECLKNVHMGAPRDYAREKQGGDWATPYEDIENGGCPGAWYRTDFVASVLRYYRRRTEGGGRVPNPALDACDDPLVHEAVQALESYEDGALSEYLENRAKAVAK